MRVNRVLPTYSGLHQRLDPVRGRCVDCGQPAIDWSLNRTTPPARLLMDETGRHSNCPYSLDPGDYTPRCHRCHLLYDGRQDSQRGSAGSNARLTKRSRPRRRATIGPGITITG
jgi:hypothetical protein